MSSAATGVSTNAILIDLLNDLKDGSHLKALLSQSETALLAISSEIAQYANQPVRAAAGSPGAKVTISAPASWTTTTGIVFSLTPQARCSVAIGTSSTRFAVSKSIDSSDTEDIVLGPTPGKVYVNIDLDFSIGASVSGGGSVSGIGISGKASGAAAATFSYCRAVDANTNTVDALIDAFSGLVFPFEPDSALRMGVGDQGRVNFDASLSFGVDISYGLGSYKFSAPGIDSVRQSAQKAFDTLTFPTVAIDAGAKASFAYTHSDHFGAIVQKPDLSSARLYLVRSAADETSGSVGITVGVKVTPLDASINRNALAAAVNRVTGTGGDQAAALASDLQSSLVSRTNQWLSNLNGDSGLLVKLSAQKKRAVLYRFGADLTKADLTRLSWERLAAGDVAAAMQIGGLTLLPGSGVGSEVRRSVSIGLHFFNFFSVTSKTVYFQNSFTELGPDGSIRFLFDVGKESDTETKKTLQTSRIHFVASATPAEKAQVANIEVDLEIELSETNRPKDGNRIASILGALPPSGTVQAAQTAMTRFVASNPKGTLVLATTLKPAAYLKLSASPFSGPKNDIPPAPPQAQDRENWNAFHDAARTLLDLEFLDELAYRDWVTFNQYSVNGDPSGLPNRRASGNPNAVPPSFYDDRGITLVAAYFLLSSARFMDLCEDLHALAGNLGQIDTLTEWNTLLGYLTQLAKDQQADWSRPSARALLQLCGPNSSVTADLIPDTDSATLTCKVTVS